MSWKSLGHALALVAKYSGQAALAVSDHPQVVAEIASLSGHPAVAQAVSQLAPVISAVRG